MVEMETCFVLMVKTFDGGYKLDSLFQKLETAHENVVERGLNPTQYKVLEKVIH